MSEELKARLDVYSRLRDELHRWMADCNRLSVENGRLREDLERATFQRDRRTMECADLTAERDALKANEPRLAAAYDELQELAEAIDPGGSMCNETTQQSLASVALDLRSERDAALARLAAAEAVIAGVPTQEPERYEGDNHGDSFSSGWDCGEVSIANRLRAALAPRANGGG